MNDLSIYGAGVVLFLTIYKGVNYIIDRARSQTLKEVKIVTLSLRIELKEFIKKEINEKIDKSEKNINEKISYAINSINEKIERLEKNKNENKKR